VPSDNKAPHITQAPQVSASQYLSPQIIHMYCSQKWRVRNC